MGTTKTKAHLFWADPADYKSTMAVNFRHDADTEENFTVPMRTLWTSKAVPSWAPVTGNFNSWGLMQIPYYSYLINIGTIEEVPLMGLAIRMKDPSDHATIDQIVSDLQVSYGSAAQ